MPGQHFVSRLVIAAVFGAMFVMAHPSFADSIRCEGTYRHHLQGVCRDDSANLYWSFTTTLVRTDANGKLLKKIDVPNHHGDLCFADGLVYVAVNLGRFNDPAGNADNWIYVYQANSLDLMLRVACPEVKHGAGGIAVHDGRFVVVGGLPEGVEENYVYEYDEKLAFVKKHTLESGYTRLGIQTATYSDGHWWFGCYGGVMLKASETMQFNGRYRFDCSLGIESIGSGKFLAASGRCVNGACDGELTPCFSRDAVQRKAEQPISHVSFGSCVKQQNPAPIFETIVAESPDLFLFVGDNIYADTTDMAEMRQKYATLAELPHFAELQRQSQVLATWDDHDYGVNDGGSEYAQKHDAQQVFVDFWRDPIDSPRRSRPGVYDARMFGVDGKRLQVILLDTRYFRGPLKKGAERRVGGPYVPDPNPSVPLLGESQWKWLAEQLRQPADLRLIVTSIQCIASDAGQETWSNLPHERTRFFRLLRECSVKNAILLSGDRHWSELSQTDAPGYPLYELTSSSLNQVHPRGTPTENRFRALDKTYHLPNYGDLTIDWEKRSVQMAIKNADGQVELQQSVSF